MGDVISSGQYIGNISDYLGIHTLGDFWNSPIPIYGLMIESKWSEWQSIGITNRTSIVINNDEFDEIEKNLPNQDSLLNNNSAFWINLL